MSEDLKYGLLFLGLGVLSLYIGVTWKRPSYGGGIVHKYASIGFGVLSIIYSLSLLLKLL